MQDKKPLLIFDCFGVVVKDDIGNLWMNNHLDKQTIQKLRAEIFPRLDIGEIDCDELFQQLSFYTNISSDKIRQEFFDLIKYDHELINLIKGLKEDYYIALLSNAPNEISQYIKKDIYSLFDECVFSCDCHMIKPGAEIYKFILDKFMGNYDYAVMIDDNIANLQGAKNAGIDYVIEYQSNLDLMQYLHSINKSRCD